ncbi:hypothetical protein T484DRAFT_1740866 [Baffinella frigidus]|nr:hypothetical protein T484DRAFT_1740866 [Cryptophyta sp. CCMP2293]
MERARAIFSAIREWLFSQGANAQGEGPGDVTHPVSHEAMLQVPSASLLPPLANPIGAARSLKHFHMCRHRTHTVARPADLQESRALVSLPDWHTSSGVGEQFLDTRWEPRLTYEEKQWTLKSWPSREILADGSVWYFSGLYPSGRAVGAPLQAKPAAQLLPEPAPPSPGASHHSAQAHNGAHSHNGAQSQNGAQSHNGAQPLNGAHSHNGAVANGAAPHSSGASSAAAQSSGGTPWRRVLNGAVGDAYYWNKATGAVQWEPPDIPGGWGDAEQDHGPGERNGHLTVERSRHSVGGEANPVAWSRMVEEAAGGGADAGGVDTGAYSTFGAEGFSTVSTMSSASSGHASQVTMAAGDAGASNLHNGEARTDALLLCDAAPPGTDQAAVVVKSSLRYQFDGEAGNTYSELENAQRFAWRCNLGAARMDRRLELFAVLVDRAPDLTLPTLCRPDCCRAGIRG